MMNIKAFTTLFLLLCGLQQASAQVTTGPAALDPSFGIGGKRTLVFPGADFRLLAHLQRPDGTSIAIAYYDNNACPVGRHCLALYPFNAAGVVGGAITVPTNGQATFSKRTGGVVLDPVLIKAAAIDSQGRIIIVGTEQFGTAFDFKVVRLLPSGQPDTSFDGDGVQTIAFEFGGPGRDFAYGVSVDPSDQIVVVGEIDRSATDTDFGVARLRVDGSLDPAFDGDGKRAVSFDLSATNSDRAVAVTATSNLIYIAGNATDNGVSRIALARLLNSGGFNTSFCATSCTFQGTYPTINNGRRVIFYGSQGTTNDFVSAASVNLATSPGEWVYAGTRLSDTFVSEAFVQKLQANGDYANEGLTNTGLTTTQYQIGGVHWVNPNSATSDIVQTGSSGLDGVNFFAQGLRSTLVPIPSWGTSGASNTVALWNATGGLGDSNGKNLPAQSSVDSAGRVLTGGSYLAGNTNVPPYSVVIARLARPVIGPEIFKNGFEN
jgi:uncharacterized delta-60 repeat protein